MKNIKRSILAVNLVLLSCNVWAQAPQKFNYQGIARNPSGQPIASAPLGLRLTIHDGAATGAIVYQELQTASTNAYGLYATSIGAGTVVSGSFAGVNWGVGDKYLQVEIDPAGGSVYTDIGTTQLLSVPYAIHANSVNLAGDVTGTATANTVSKIQGVAVASTAPAAGQVLKFDGSAYLPAVDIDTQKLFVSGASLTISGGNTVTLPAGMGGTGTTGYLPKFLTTSAIGNSEIFDNGTNIGIGTATPAATAKLNVIGSSNQNGISGTSAAIAYAGVAGSNSAANGFGIWGSVSGTGVAGYFDGGATGRGIMVPAGAVGIGTAAPIGRLVVSQLTNAGIDTAAAIYGYTLGPKACYKGGVFGTYNALNFGVGVQGIGFQGVPLADAPASFPNVSASSDFGVYGSGNTAGVLGTSLTSSGVRGVSVSSGGVVGYSQSTTTGGVLGIGNSIGVFANAVTVGSASVPVTRYGIFAQATGAGVNLAGYFNGDVGVAGTFSKGAGTFKIDHPLDPENKYLYHSFVESPDMMNIYNGNITTGANGFATVVMPDYFDALNKDFRYQLTVIGTFAQAIVKEEMKGNQFTIQTSQPNVKVSWQVTGVRHDKYAEAHRVQPETQKEQENKGLYLHPAEWHQPEEKGITYKITHQQEVDAAKTGRGPAAKQN